MNSVAQEIMGEMVDGKTEADLTELINRLEEKMRGDRK